MSAAPNSPDGAAEPKTKLRGREFYESIGSPKYILAPMVDQSEFAWRMLVRSYLAPAQQPTLLCYTPMFHARLYAEAPSYRAAHYEPTRAESSTAETSAVPSTLPHLDGNPSLDRPLLVQFCANDPTYFRRAAALVSPHCDAVDLNLGCPQGIARRGHYGAFLQEDTSLVSSILSASASSPSIPVPVTAKIRVLDTPAQTLAYARQVVESGASILAVHGRRREQKGHLTGLADWAAIRALRDQLPREVVVFANGNVLAHEDLARCLDATGADGVMSAEGALSDPAIFATPPAPGEEGREYWRGRDRRGGWRVDGVVRRYADVLWRYCSPAGHPPERAPLFLPGDDAAWLDAPAAAGDGGEEGPARKKRKTAEEGKKKKKKGNKGGKPVTSPNLVAVRPHMFHLLRHFCARHTDVRDMLARLSPGDLEGLEEVVKAVERKCAEGLREYEATDGKSWEEEERELDRRTVAKLRGEDRKNAGDKGNEALESAIAECDETDATKSSLEAVRRCRRPWWICQPIIRPLPMEALANRSVQLGKKEIRKLQGEKAEQTIRKEIAKPNGDTVLAAVAG